MAAELLGELQASAPAAQVTVSAERCGSAARPIARRARGAPALRRASANFHLGPARSAAAARGPGGARRAQRRAWPALPAPDPWLPPKVRANLGMPALEFAHRPCRARFRERARRARSADHPGAARRPLADRRLALPAAARCDQRRLAARPQARAADRGARRPGPAAARSTDRRPRRPPSSGPKRISVTAVDRLKADPFAFYAQAILRLRAHRSGRRRPYRRVEGQRGPRGARAMARSRTIAIPTSCGRAPSDCSRTRRSTRCCARLWAPRLLEAIDWIAALERDNQARGPPPARGRSDRRSRARRDHRPRPRRPDRPARRRRPRDRRLQDRRAADPEGGRRGLRAAARPAWR